MAVIVKYFIVRNGIELDKAFTDKREADAYDKMLDAADELENLIRGSGLEIALNDETVRDIAVVLAKNGPEVVKILKNIKPLGSPRETPETDGDEDPTKDKSASEKSKRKTK